MLHLNLILLGLKFSKLLKLFVIVFGWHKMCERNNTLTETLTHVQTNEKYLQNIQGE